MSLAASQNSLQILRGELIPAADRLCHLVEKLGMDAPDGVPEADAEQFSRDLKKLHNEAPAFRSGIAQWFGEDVSTDSRFSAALRKSRHDARNQLNHLFGTIQLMQMFPCPPEFLDRSREIVGVLESCLALVSGTAAIAEESEEPPEASHLPCEPGESAGIILVADDDPENREILDRLLQPCGFEVQFAENGRIAIEKIEANDFDAVLLDIEMPEMDGFQVLESLRESGHLRYTPVIVVTGLQEEQDAVRCIEIGAEDFLSRPIRPALLMARLNASLEKKRLREKVFEQHFTPELARELARNPDPMKMQARQAEVSVLFCDIRGFSSISERLGPSQTIDWLGGVMGEFSTRVIELGGVLVDYTGDELMAMWGAPNVQPNHAELACRAAMEIRKSLDDLNEKWRPVVDAETEVGIGVNTGEALVGNVGTHRKFKYGPLGTVVNLASRVQGATKYLRTPMLVTGYTAAQLPLSFSRRRLCQVRVQNIQAPVHLYELEPPGARPDWAELAKRYQDSLEEFESGNFRKASSILSDVLLESPDDGPGLQLMARIVESMLNDGEEFSPVWELPGK
ncbi:MAG: response regulator [Verrucomicrobiales bacterium]|nr:response regulator [Verrucomicrobiales bacterium]